MKKRKPIILILILAVLAGGIYYATTRQAHEIILTGIVTTDEVIVSSEIQGRLQQLLVQQGDKVNLTLKLTRISPDFKQPLIITTVDVIQGLPPNPLAVKPLSGCVCHSFGSPHHSRHSKAKRVSNVQLRVENHHSPQIESG